MERWRDTDTVINWFKNIDNKGNCIFMQFDIEEKFLPFHFKRSFNGSNKSRSVTVTISKEEVKTIMHSRKSL